jgi:hypothetical protein
MGLRFAYSAFRSCGQAGPRQLVHRHRPVLADLGQHRARFPLGAAGALCIPA